MDTSKNCPDQSKNVQLPSEGYEASFDKPCGNEAHSGCGGKCHCGKGQDPCQKDQRCHPQCSCRPQ